MKKQNLTLYLASFIGALFLFDANAVPTVKKLGVSNNVVRTNNNATTNTNGSSVSRISSTRLNTAKPVKVSSVSSDNYVATKTTNVSVPDSNESRLSLGKYLHSVNVNKPEAIGTTPSVASKDFIDLTERVSKTEADIETVTQDFEEHIKNEDIHVTLDDKDRWNEKQDALTAGDGIKISDQGVISSVMLLPVGSEDAKPTAPIWIQ